MSFIEGYNSDILHTYFFPKLNDVRSFDYEGYELNIGNNSALSNSLFPSHYITDIELLKNDLNERSIVILNGGSTTTFRSPTILADQNAKKEICKKSSLSESDYTSLVGWASNQELDLIEKQERQRWLFSLVLASKGSYDRDTIKIATRAIEILNRSGFSFSHLDLSYIQIPHADLRGAILYGADLHGAILDFVKLKGANLEGADFTECSLVGIDIELKLCGIRTELITSFALSSKNTLAAIDDQSLIIWNGNGGPTCTFDFEKILDANTRACDICSLDFHPLGDKILIGTKKGYVYVFDYQTKVSYLIQDPRTGEPFRYSNLHFVRWTPLGNLISHTSDGYCFLGKMGKNESEAIHYSKWKLPNETVFYHPDEECFFYQKANFFVIEDFYSPNSQKAYELPSGVLNPSKGDDATVKYCDFINANGNRHLLIGTSTHLFVSEANTNVLRHVTKVQANLHDPIQWACWSREGNGIFYYKPRANTFFQLKKDSPNPSLNVVLNENKIIAFIPSENRDFIALQTKERGILQIHMSDYPIDKSVLLEPVQSIGFSKEGKLLILTNDSNCFSFVMMTGMLYNQPLLNPIRNYLKRGINQGISLFQCFQALRSELDLTDDDYYPFRQFNSTNSSSHPFAFGCEPYDYYGLAYTNQLDFLALLNVNYEIETYSVSKETPLKKIPLFKNYQMNENNPKIHNKVVMSMIDESYVFCGIQYSEDNTQFYICDLVNKITRHLRSPHLPDYISPLKKAKAFIFIAKNTQNLYSISLLGNQFLPTCLPYKILSFDCNEKNQWIALSGDNQKVEIYNYIFEDQFKLGDRILTLELNELTDQIALSPDGNYLICVSNKGYMVKMWQIGNFRYNPHEQGKAGFQARLLWTLPVRLDCTGTKINFKTKLSTPDRFLFNRLVSFVFHNGNRIQYPRN